MTVRAAVSKLLVEEHADVLREAVRVMLREVMEAEVSTAAGADSDERVAQRNGYRGREWDTRVGTIELAIPRLRTGSNGFCASDRRLSFGADPALDKVHAAGTCSATSPAANRTSTSRWCGAKPQPVLLQRRRRPATPPSATGLPSRQERAHRPVGCVPGPQRLARTRSWTRWSQPSRRFR